MSAGAARNGGSRRWVPRAAAAILVLIACSPCQAGSLSVYEGNGCIGAKNLEHFSAWLGHRPDWVLDFFAHDTWESLQSDAAWTVSCWQKAHIARVTFSVPMLVNGSTLSAGAEGAYDARFRELAQVLIEHGYGDSVLRLGWEFNGGWYPWSAKRDPKAWVAYWRRIVSVMRAVPGAHFKFCWCPTLGEGQLRPDSVYPGDAVVDVIGEDVYNQWWDAGSHTPGQRWNYLVNEVYGLKWQSDFARAHGKPLSFPEWGTGTRPDGYGGGDDPYFIEHMVEWIRNHDLLYYSYFDYAASDYNARLSDGHQPLAAAAFLAAFRS